MKRSSRPDLSYLVEMNLTKSAAASKLGVTSKILDVKCKERFSMTWDEIKQAQRDKKNKELGSKTPGKIFYYSQKQPMWRTR